MWYSLSNTCRIRLLWKAPIWLWQTLLLCCIALCLNGIFWSLMGQIVTIWRRFREWENRSRSWRCNLRSLPMWLLRFLLTRNIPYPMLLPDEDPHHTFVPSFDMSPAPTSSTYLTNSPSNTNFWCLSSTFSLCRRQSRQKLWSLFSSWKKGENAGQTYFFVLHQDTNFSFCHDSQFFLVIPHLIVGHYLCKLKNTHDITLLNFRLYRWVSECLKKCNTCSTGRCRLTIVQRNLNISKAWG